MEIIPKKNTLSTWIDLNTQKTMNTYNNKKSEKKWKCMPTYIMVLSHSAQ